MLTLIRHRWTEWLDRWSDILESLDSYDPNAVLGGYLN